jgi:hypothetical protein
VGGVCAVAAALLPSAPAAVGVAWPEVVLLSAPAAAGVAWPAVALPSALPSAPAAAASASPGGLGPGAVRPADACAATTAGGVAYCRGADHGRSGAGVVPVSVRPRPPAAVTGLTVTALDGGLRASWRPAAGFGTGTFISYLALTTNFESSCEVTTATGTGCELLGLVNGAEYEVAVLTYASDGSTVSASAGAVPSTPSMLAPGLAPVLANPMVLAAAGCLLVGAGLAALLIRR